MTNWGTVKRKRVVFAWAVLVSGMIRKLLLFFGTLFVHASCIIHHSSLASFAAPPASVAEVVKNLQKRYDSTAGFRADFVQEVESATLGQKIEARGTMVFKKPGRMRWEIVEPQQLLVSDGKFFWLYQQAENQVVKTPFQRAFTSNTPASFLLGIGQLDKDFTPSLTGETSEAYQLRLTPKQDPEAIGTLDLTVDAKTFDIRQAVITDPLGNVTRLRLSNINRSDPLKDELFHFTVPPGADVVEPIPSAPAQ